MLQLIRDNGSLDFRIAINGVLFIVCLFPFEQCRLHFCNSVVDEFVGGTAVTFRKSYWAPIPNDPRFYGPLNNQLTGLIAFDSDVEEPNIVAIIGDSLIKDVEI